MSTGKKIIIQSIKTINLKKKNSSNFQNLSTVSNDSMIIRTNNNISYNNYNRSTTLNKWKNNLSRIYHPNHRVQSAQLNNKPNQISKSTLTMEKKNINKFYDYKSNFLNNDNKENKENQVNFIFNNSILNNYCSNKPVKVNNYFLQLNKFYNPHFNYSKIVKSEKNVIRELISQTKNNFNNKYKLRYFIPSPEPKKGKKILKWFNKIRENKSKNIDKKNAIEIIAIKSIPKNNRKKKKNEKNKININKHILFPSSFNINNFINKTDKVKIKTMKITDEIIQENYKTLSNKNQVNLYSSGLDQKKLINNMGEEVFKTVPKNGRNINNDYYYEYSKSSSFE